MTDTTPTPVRNLANRLAPTWHVTITPGAGHLERGTRGEPRNDGTRPLITTTHPVQSWAVRAHHPDGRAIRVVYALEPGATTSTGRAKAPTVALAWRARHPGEATPQPLAATEVATYTDAPDPAAALRALDELRARRAADAAARKAGKRAATVLHPQPALDLGFDDEAGQVAA